MNSLVDRLVSQKEQ
jgi:hypothetical protein